MKDKSAWRKSNLNVANSSEATKDESRHRHTLPRSTPSYTTDDDGRKTLISSLGERPPTDKLTLYICQPTTSSSRNTLDSISPLAQSSQQSLGEAVSNKVEIDQDNIETPPATRRVFTPTPVDKREPIQPNPCRRFMGRATRDSPDEPEPSTVLGDGQFDRFSAARRTRRYKRNTETAEVTSPELVAEKEIIKPMMNQFSVETSSPVVNVDGAETRLQAWKERLNKTQVDEVKNKRSRHQTSVVNQEDVKQALGLVVTSSAPISIASMDVAGGGSRSYLNAETTTTGNRKTKEHDNDEGFEETQSLMSESPSQGASSGGNYEADLVDAAHVYNKTKPKAKNANSSSEISKTVKTKSVATAAKPNNNRNFERNNILRQTTQEISNKNKSVIPRRSGSLRKTGSQANVGNNKKNNVQRSGSRNSIVSSRSSLNSATSSSTVKRLPIKANTAVNSNKTAQKTIIPNNKIVNSNNVKSSMNTKRAAALTNVSTATQKPPRPSLSSFMKPTTASATKSTVLPSRMQTSSFRSKR